MKRIPSLRDCPLLFSELNRRELYTDKEKAFHWLLKGRTGSVTGTWYLELLEKCKYVESAKYHQIRILKRQTAQRMSYRSEKS